MTTNLTDPQAPVSDEELDQMIWKLERDDMTPKLLSLMIELREVRKAKPVVPNAVDENIDADDHPLLWGHNKGWNACRAAMLQTGNSPVTPDGWIPVSERMPEDRVQVALWDADIGELTSGHYSHKTKLFYHCGEIIENEITHWMALQSPKEVG